MRKLGINYEPWGMPDRDTFRLIADAGFDSVFTLMNSQVPGKTGIYAKAISDAGLRYECIHAPFHRINDIWNPGNAGESMLSQLTRTVETCADYSIPIAVVHLSSGEHAPCVNDIGHRRLDRLVETAVRTNVILAFENQRKLANLAFVMELYDNCPQVRFCWDVGHEACFTGGREYMPLFGKKLVYTHIHDNNMEYNGDLHLIPFDGKIDYTRTVSHLKKAGYEGTLTLEVTPMNMGCARYQEMTAEEFYRRAYNAADRLRTMLDTQAQSL